MVWARKLPRDEGGMTLVELLVAMFVLGVVMVVFTSVLASVQRAVARQDSLTRTLNQARLAIEQIDRELRSGNVYYDPSQENPAYYTLRIYTQANAPTRTPSPGYLCVLWQIDANQRLLVRSWPPLQPDEATPWRVVATGIVNRALGEGDPQNRAFQIDADPLKGGRTLDITLAVNDQLAERPTQTVRLSTSVTGRNTSYGYPVNVCAELPT
jgi:prepilin-type N-terminal cleavage/methylation domain-containing protein